LGSHIEMPNDISQCNSIVTMLQISKPIIDVYITQYITILKACIIKQLLNLEAFISKLILLQMY